MEDQFAPGKSGTQAPNIKEFFYKYIRFLPLIVLSVALALLVAYLFLRYTTPVYRSSAPLFLKSNTGQEGGNNSGDRFAQLFVLDNSINVQSEIELLKSRQLMERVIRKLGLHYYYYTKGNIRAVHHYKDVPFFVQHLSVKDSAKEFSLELEFITENTFRLAGGNKKYTFGQTIATPEGSFKLVPLPIGTIGEAYKVTWKPIRQLASELIENLLVAPKGTTGIITLALETTEPQLAADVLNQLMREYQVATIEDKNETKRQTLDFIDDRLQVVSHELDSVTQSLLDYQRANNIIDPEAQSSSFLTKMDAYEEQVSTQQMQINMADIIEAYLRDRKNHFNVVPSSLGLADPTLNTMISAYNVAQLERKALIEGNVPATNSRVQQMTSQIEQLRQNILESIRNVRSSYQVAIDRLQQNRGAVSSQIAALPVKEQALLEIKRQQEMKQGVFNFLMEKREESAISLAATISNIKVVEEAAAVKDPVKPDRKNIQLIAIALGLILPSLGIFIMELLNDKVNSRADIEKATDVPILGEVGHSFTKETLIVKPNNRGIVAEQFRIIRSNLQYVLSGIEKPVVLVTSSFSGEGKSFVSTNIGAVLSLANKRTIILEFDIRKPKVLAGLGMSKKPGLTNWMLGKVKIEDLPVPVEGYSNLFVLPCGPIPPNPSEMLLGQQITELFSWLKDHFDVIVVDTAPVGIVSDALTLSRFADATLYITRQGRTFKKQLELIDDFYQQAKLPRMAIVLNDVKLQSGYGYYGYGKYGYGYGYGQGSGYFEEEPSANGNGRKLMRWFKKKKA